MNLDWTWMTRSLPPGPSLMPWWHDLLGCLGTPRGFGMWKKCKQLLAGFKHVPLNYLKVLPSRPRQSVSLPLLHLGSGLLDQQRLAEGHCPLPRPSQAFRNWQLYLLY